MIEEKKELLNSKIVASAITALIVLSLGFISSLMIKENLSQFFDIKISLEKSNAKIDLLSFEIKELEKKIILLEDEQNKIKDRELNRAEKLNKNDY